MNDSSVLSWPFVVETSLGPVPLRGRLSSDSRRPLLFVIGGVFPPKNYLQWLPAAIPNADVVIADLPGMITPQLNRRDISAWHTAYGEIVTGLFASRRVTAVGVSAGCLLTLGLAAAVDSMILVEPVLRPGAVAALWDWIEPVMRKQSNPVKIAEYILELLGKRGQGPDYRPLADRAPAALHVLVGSIMPDSPRPAGEPPSFTPEDERALWTTKGFLHVLSPVGHDIPGRAPGEFVRALSTIVGRHSGDWGLSGASIAIAP